MPRLVADDPKFAALATAPTPRLLDDAFHTILGRWSRDEWQVPGVERVDAFVARVRAALDRVAKPIFATFSRRDFALHDTFHLALRRDADLGEARIAGDDDEPPSKYAALGGYGPRGADERIVPVQDVGQRYEMSPATRIYGIRADRTISGHGDISNESTWWALYCQSN